MRGNEGRRGGEEEEEEWGGGGVRHGSWMVSASASPQPIRACNYAGLEQLWLGVWLFCLSPGLCHRAISSVSHLVYRSGCILFRLIFRLSI